MKYLLVLAIVLVALWFWRNSRRAGESREDQSSPASKSTTASNGQPQDMVECPICLVHLPRTDALPGPDGRLYCCAEHRLRAGG
jgi:uncharacterized protein